MDQFVVYVRQVLETTPERWLRLTDSVEVELLRRQAAPGEWSAAECLQHLLDTEFGAFRIRLDSFLAGRPRLAAFDPNAAGSAPDPSGDPRALARRLVDARRDSLAMLDRVTAADLGRVAEHDELGRVTLHEMLAEWAGHDLNHTIQAERALMQPFIDACGPWRPYFSDQDMAAK
jgi:hypothetical protein